MEDVFTTLNVRHVTNKEEQQKAIELFKKTSATNLQATGARYKVTRRHEMKYSRRVVLLGKRPTEYVSRGLALMLEVEQPEKDTQKKRMTLVSTEAFYKQAKVDCSEVRFATPVAVAPVEDGPRGFVYVAYKGRRGRCEVFQMSAASYAHVTSRRSEDVKTLLPIHVPLALVQGAADNAPDQSFRMLAAVFRLQREPAQAVL